MIKRLSERFAKHCAELAQWLYDKDCLLFLADALYRFAYWIYLQYQKPVMVKYISDEWMYDWIFHFNVYSKTWHAYNREDSSAYWSGGKTIHPVIEANCMTSLIQKLKQTQVETNPYEYDNGY